MTRAHRTRLATGIYQDVFGVAIIISVQGKPVEHRDADRYPGKDTAWLQAERVRLQAAAALKTERQIAKGETFAADAVRYLRTLSSPSHLKDATRLIGHWSAVFGERQRNEITPMEIQEQFARWAYRKPSTRNHLRHTLIAFYKTLNGPQGHNPAAVLKKVRERYDDSRALPYAVIDKIFAALAPSKAKARLMVMAYTGLPQAQIAQLQPHDVQLDRKAVYVRPRRKGAGVAGRLLPLSASGITAFKAFIKAHAFGPFERRQVHNVWKNGVAWAGVTLPPGTRPYDLRHSFLTEVYRQTGDLNAVAELGMHATLEQTARYARGAVSERAKKAVRTVPRIPKRGTTPNGSNLLHLVPQGATGAWGSNQYRKRTKPAKSQREKTLKRS